MKKQERLIHKIKRLIKRAGLPQWLHRYGPKKYQFWQHALAFIVKQECRLGYRRTSNLLHSLGFNVPTYSALAKMEAKLPLNIRQKIFEATIDCKFVAVAAIDGTGMSRPLPSPHYYKRIEKPFPVDIPLKLSIICDAKSKKILALRMRAKQKTHDIRDAKYLINKLPVKIDTLIGDKAYDAKWLRLYCKEKGIQTCIPPREFKKAKREIKWFKKKARRLCNPKIYPQRNLVESTIGATKRKFGPSVSSTKFNMMRKELYWRAIAHNIISHILRLFQRSRNKAILRHSFIRTVLHSKTVVVHYCRRCKAFPQSYYARILQWCMKATRQPMLP